MTGPEHYREAERLLGAANSAPKPHASGGVVLTMIGNLIAEAQVHATLALAAATAASQATAYDGDEDFSRTRGWAGVA